MSSLPHVASTSTDRDFCKSGILQIPDCSRHEALPLCAPLIGVTNLSNERIRIEGWFPQLNIWAPLIPQVEPARNADALGGALWLPKTVVLRSVSEETGLPLTTFGALGEGMRVVQGSTF